MKKTLFTVLSLCILLCMCIFSLSSCNEEDTTNPEVTSHQHVWSAWTTVTPATCTSNGSQERTCACGEKETQPIDSLQHSYEIGKCTACNYVAYRLTYVSNNDGTCYVSQITTNPDIHEDYVLEIPETSPDGDHVTAVRSADFANMIPKMLLVEDYEKMIAAMKAKVDAGELDQFYYDKLQAYFYKHALSEKTSIKAKEQLLSAYPICAITDIYTYATDASRIEDFWMIFHLETYCNYSKNALIADYQHLYDFVNESDAENKSEILATLPTIPTNFAGHIISIETPNTLEEISVSLYSSCYDLKELTLPNCITEIPGDEFSWHSNLASVTIPNSVTSIGDSAFENCMSLTSITIPDSITSISGRAFSGCTSLTSITIPDSITTIGNYAFEDCTSLTSITIPNSVTTIGNYAFEGCTSLTSITVQEGNSKYHSSGNCLIETESKTLILGCKNSVIPTDGSVTSIGDSAFEGCTSLTSITIPNSVTTIGNYAFKDCTSLTSITIPDSVTIIHSLAFCGCTSLTSITIPNSVTTIGNYAFEDCTNLTDITIPNSVTNIGWCAFSNCTSLTTVYYGGTAEDWAKISIVSDNSYLTNATIYYYSETQPTDTANNYWHYVDGVPTAWETETTE